MKKEEIDRFVTTERRMVRWMWEVSLRDELKSNVMYERMGLAQVGRFMRGHRLRWYDHVVQLGSAI